MKTRHQISVALLNGILLVGCDSKKDKDKTDATPGTPAGPADTTKTAVPTKADVAATTQQIANDAKNDYNKLKDAGQSGLSKIEQKVPTSAPSLPSFGK